MEKLTTKASGLIERDHNAGKSIMRRLMMLWCLCGVWLATLALAQAPKPEYVASATLDHADGMYKCDEEAVFSVTLKHNDVPMTAGDFDWILTVDGVKKIAAGKGQLGEQPAQIKGTLIELGILRLTIVRIDDQSTQLVPIGAGYEVEKIRPTCVEPDDFAQYWEQQKALVRAIPPDVQMVKVDDRCNDKQTTYRISFADIENTRIYGWLSVPNAAGLYPAILTLPSAGCAPGDPGSSWAQAGFLSMVLYIHNYPIDLPAEKYVELQNGKLAGYMVRGRENRDTYYFRRVFLGCTRFMDYLMSRPEWDGKHLIVTGASQGGGLSLICAGLEPRVTAIVAHVPAMCDHTGCLSDRASGWPQLIPNKDPNIAKISAYYDAVNFARHAKCATLISTGFADTSCPATSVYSVYAVLPQPKRIVPTPDMGHHGWAKNKYLSDKFIIGLGKMP
ncbi:MAG: acetylxylan esterase [Kiritimatiellaeota bacterium]|nr:acetylxylan esterase [Kiritimatiellota bacterium]